MFSTPHRRLNRLTGEPLFPVEEKPVPRTDVPGEELSPTQPYSSLGAVNATAIDFAHLNGTSAVLRNFECKIGGILAECKGRK